MAKKTLGWVQVCGGGGAELALLLPPLLSRLADPLPRGRAQVVLTTNNPTITTIPTNSTTPFLTPNQQCHKYGG